MGHLVLLDGLKPVVKDFSLAINRVLLLPAGHDQKAVWSCLAPDHFLVLFKLVERALANACPATSTLVDCETPDIVLSDCARVLFVVFVA